MWQLRFSNLFAGFGVGVWPRAARLLSKLGASNFTSLRHTYERCSNATVRGRKYDFCELSDHILTAKLIISFHSMSLEDQARIHCT